MKTLKFFFYKNKIGSAFTRKEFYNKLKETDPNVNIKDIQFVNITKDADSETLKNMWLKYMEKMKKRRLERND